MKYLSTILSLVALIALVPARVAADDAEGGDEVSGDDWKRPDHPHRPHPPPPPPPPPPHKPTKTQVLWGQCGGYYYYGTTECPEGAYCRYFSNWYSQCNLNGQ